MKKNINKPNGILDVVISIIGILVSLPIIIFVLCDIINGNNITINITNVILFLVISFVFVYCLMKIIKILTKKTYIIKLNPNIKKRIIIMVLAGVPLILGSVLTINHFNTKWEDEVTVVKKEINLNVATNLGYFPDEYEIENNTNYTLTNIIITYEVDGISKTWKHKKRLDFSLEPNHSATFEIKQGELLKNAPDGINTYYGKKIKHISYDK